MSTEVKWTCKECGTENTDDYSLTNWPRCEYCGKDYVWSQILPAPKQRKLNQRLAEPNQEPVTKQS